jgi:hypothetical protein
MRRSLSERFPTVARLLAGAAFVDDAPTPKPDEDDGEGGDGEGTDGDGEQQTPPPADTDTNQADGEDNGGEGDDTSANATTGAASAAILAGFEKDADALVLAEQKRCITVFTSDAGKRNPAGAAELLVEDLSAEKIISLLGTVGGSARATARERLNASTDVRPQTGAVTDGAAASVDTVKSEHAARRDKRNKAAKAKGGVKVGRTPGADD